MRNFIILLSCVAEICFGASVAQLDGQKVAVVDKRQSVLCQLCEFAMGELENLIQKNATEKDIENFLENDVCGLLPSSLADACKQAVEKDLPGLIKMLVNKEDPKKICAQLTLCQAKVVTRRQSVICPLCELAVKEVENLIKKNSSEKDIVKALENVCDLLPGGTAQECKQMVDEFAPKIISMILNKEDPKTVCVQLGICQSKVVNRRQLLCPLCELAMKELENLIQKNATEKDIENFLENDVCGLLPSGLADACKQAVEQDLPGLIKMLVNKEDPKKICSQLKLCQEKVVKKRQLLCPLCEIAVKELENLIQKNATEKDIENLLENDVCGLLPSGLADACKQAVEQDLPGLIKMLVNKEDPKKICSQLKLCQERVVKKRQLLCPLCEIAMKELENLIQKNATEKDIENFLENDVCGLLPSGLADACKQAVEQDLPGLIKMLVNKEDPKKICSQLKLCQERGIERRQIICPLCEFAMKELENLIQENATEKDIENFLENDVCGLLPSSLADACKQAVEQNLPGLIKMLVNKEDPKKICAQLKLCQERVFIKGRAGPLCALCEFAIQQLENTIQKNPTEQDIEKALEQVCNLLPDAIKQECDDFIQVYSPSIIDLLVKKADPKDICTKLTLCSEKTRKGT